jgi:ABC-type phosphate transport system substrate-binding protein
MLTTDEFTDKFYKNLLTDEDLEDIYYLTNFQDTSNSYWEQVEEAEDYIIFKIINREDKSEQFFIFTKKSYNIFKVDYKYPTFI